MSWSKLIDLELDDEDQLSAAMPIPMTSKPKYPFGLRICLTEKELAKLRLDHDCDIGDMLHLVVFATVTSVSKHENDDGACCRVELQIEKMAAENESLEMPDDDD